MLMNEASDGIAQYETIMHKKVNKQLYLPYIATLLLKY